MSTMFDQKEMDIRLGGEAKFTAGLDIHKPVEAFLLDAIKSYPSMACYDLDAGQPLQFWTINYTTYAGFFCMFPLNAEIKQWQIQSSLMGVKDYDYVGYIFDTLKNGSANKYENMNENSAKFEALAVLSGSNIFNNAIDINKLRWVVEEHGSLAAIKPHPLTNDDNLKYLRENLLPNASILDKSDDMYPIMDHCNVVYAPHSSSSVIQAVCLGKAVSPLSPFRSRVLSGFGHINDVLFSTDQPQKAVNLILSNYRSGIVHPEIHSNWQDRIIRYLDYIHDARKRFKDAYK